MTKLYGGIKSSTLRHLSDEKARMTNDEMATRLIRLEARLTAVTAMVHCLLPATVPSRRKLVGDQFGYWRDVMEKEMREVTSDSNEATLQVDVIAAYHQGLLAALSKVDEMEIELQSSSFPPPAPL